MIVKFMLSAFIVVALLTLCSGSKAQVIVPEEVVKKCIDAGGCVMATKDQIDEAIKKAYEKGREEGKLICRKTT